MTQTDPDYTDDQIDDETPAIRAAREAADRGNSRADAAERRNALLELLPPIENKALRGMFLDSYKGDVTEEAVTTALLEAGLIATPAPETTDQDVVDAAAQSARADLGTGALAPTEEPDPELVEDPRSLGLAEFRAAKQRGATNKNAAPQFFDRVVSAAVRGDERALFTGWTEEQLAGGV